MARKENRKYRKKKISMQCCDQSARVWISEEGKYVPVAENMDLLPYTTEEAGGFVGCTVGVYASANGCESSNHADFAWLTCEAMSE